MTDSARAHRGLGFALPPAIARLDAYLRGQPEKRQRLVESALGVAYPAQWVGRPVEGALSSATVAGELGYTGHPFEVIPFAWQGGDGLTYAMLVHAAELGPRCPVVSHAPVDDGGPVWLGDDADEALANLMGVALRDAGDGYRDPDEVEERAEAKAETLAATREVARMLRVTPSKRVTGFTAGARSKRREVRLEVPRGWRWVATGKGMGALAPKNLFDPALGKHVLPRWPEAGPELERARTSLKRGFPASALAVARKVYATTYDDRNVAAAEVMREAYESLERPFLVARVDAYLAERAADKQHTQEEEEEEQRKKPAGRG